MSYLETIENHGNMIFQELNKDQHSHLSRVLNSLRKVDVQHQKDAVVKELIVRE